MIQQVQHRYSFPHKGSAAGKVREVSYIRVAMALQGLDQLIQDLVGYWLLAGWYRVLRYGCQISYAFMEDIFRVLNTW